MAGRKHFTILQASARRGRGCITPPLKSSAIFLSVELKCLGKGDLLKSQRKGNTFGFYLTYQNAQDNFAFNGKALLILV